MKLNITLEEHMKLVEYMAHEWNMIHLLERR